MLVTINVIGGGMRYYLDGKRAYRAPWLVIGMVLVAVGLLVWDLIQYGSLMTYVFTGIK